MAELERFVCTKENPWSKDKSQFAHHPDAIDVGECLDGCCDYYRCPHCGERFRVEVAQ